MSANDKRGRTLGIIALALIFLLIVFVVLNHTSPNSPSTRTLSEDSPLVLPSLESRFVEIISTAQADSKRTDNDMQKGGVKSRRDRSICSALTSYAVNDWVGTVEKIDSNSDGKGVLEIAIAPDVTVGTWNNELSDIGSNTLIDPGSQVFESASAMKNGQLVAFSGTFLPGSSGDCLSESSITLDGKIESPDFIFRFSKVSPYNGPPKPTEALREPTSAPIDKSSPSAYTSDASPEPNTVSSENSPQAATRPNALPESDPTPTASTGQHPQTLSAAEAVPQAIALWDQKRYSEAEPLLSRACYNGAPEACRYLGLIFDLGRGDAEDSSRARELYLKACRAGVEMACNDLNVLLSYEPDLAQCTSSDAKAKASVTSDSCNSGNGTSCVTLGHLYRYGCGVPKSSENALQTYQKACSTGTQQGCDEVKELQ